jgi:hypothetical protein
MTKIKNPNELSEKILSPLIKYCSERRGAFTQVLELFNKSNSKKVSLGQIQKWLTSDRKKSAVPSGGSLLRLIECWRELRQPDTVNNPQPTMFCAANGCQGVPTDGIIKCKVCEMTL